MIYPWRARFVDIVVEVEETAGTGLVVVLHGQMAGRLSSTRWLAHLGADAGRSGGNVQPAYFLEFFADIDPLGSPSARSSADAGVSTSSSLEAFGTSTDDLASRLLFGFGRANGSVPA